MSVFRAFRSGGRVNSRGIFDFEDEFGQDPIRSRYANTTMAREDSESRVRLAASEMELAKASLEAMTEPARQTAMFLEDLNKAAKAKNDMMKASRVNAQAIKFREQLDGAKDYDSIIGIAANPDFSDVLQDPEHKARYDARVLGLQTQTLASLQGRLNSASSPEEINSVLVSVPVAFQADPEFNRTVSGLTAAATARVNLLRASQASSAIGSATNTQQFMDAQRQYADVLQDPRVAQTAAANQRQLDIEQRLKTAGIDPSRYAYRTGPEGEEMGYDFDAAERDLEQIPTQREIGGLETSIKRMTERKQQAAENVLGDDGTAVTWTDSDEANLNFLTKQLETRLVQFYRPKNTPTTSGNPAVDDFNVLMPESARTRISGQPQQTTSATTPAAPAAASDAAAPAQPAPEPQAAAEKQEPTKPFDPKDRAEVARTEAELQRAREEAGLAAQPAGIRQINEAFAAQYSGVREKARSAQQARENINPFEGYDPEDAQSIQRALDVVYPDLGDGRFDVGSATDPRVVSAAEYLQKVNPSLLRAVASSPGSNRAGLSLQEISDLAEKAKRTPRGKPNK